MKENLVIIPTYNEKENIEKSRRGETLHIDEYIGLSKALKDSYEDIT